MKKLAFILSLLASPAFAQTASPQEQIERTIGKLYVENVTLAAQVATLQAELIKARDRVKELEDVKK